MISPRQCLLGIFLLAIKNMTAPRTRQLSHASLPAEVGSRTGYPAISDVQISTRITTAEAVPLGPIIAMTRSTDM